MDDCSLAPRMPPAIEADIKYKTAKEKWRQGYARLSKANGAPTLSIYKSAARCAHNEYNTKCRYDLSKFLGFESGFRLDKSDNVLLLMWLDCVALAGSGESDLYPSVLYVSLRTRVVLQSWNAWIRIYLGPCMQFGVRVECAPSGSFLQSCVGGEARLHLTNHRFTLVGDAPAPTPLAHWHIAWVRKYGCVQTNKFVFEAGSSSGSRREGRHVLLSAKCTAIDEAMKLSTTGQLAKWGQTRNCASVQTSLPSPAALNAGTSRGYHERGRSADLAANVPKVSEVHPLLAPCQTLPKTPTLWKDVVRIVKSVNTPESTHRCSREATLLNKLAVAAVGCVETQPRGFYQHSESIGEIFSTRSEHVSSGSAADCHAAPSDEHNPLACHCGYPRRLGTHVPLWRTAQRGCQLYAVPFVGGDIRCWRLRPGVTLMWNRCNPLFLCLFKFYRGRVSVLGPVPQVANYYNFDAVFFPSTHRMPSPACVNVEKMDDANGLGDSLATPLLQPSHYVLMCGREPSRGRDAVTPPPDDPAAGETESSTKGGRQKGGTADGVAGEVELSRLVRGFAPPFSLRHGRATPLSPASVQPSGTATPRAAATLWTSNAGAVGRRRAWSLLARGGLRRHANTLPASPPANCGDGDGVTRSATSMSDGTDGRGGTARRSWRGGLWSSGRYAKRLWHQFKAERRRTLPSVVVSQSLSDASAPPKIVVCEASLPGTTVPSPIEVHPSVPVGASLASSHLDLDDPMGVRSRSPSACSSGHSGAEALYLNVQPRLATAGKASVPLEPSVQAVAPDEFYMNLSPAIRKDAQWRPGGYGGALPLDPITDVSTETAVETPPAAPTELHVSFGQPQANNQRLSLHEPIGLPTCQAAPPTDLNACLAAHRKQSLRQALNRPVRPQFARGDVDSGTSSQGVWHFVPAPQSQCGPSAAVGPVVRKSSAYYLGSEQHKLSGSSVSQDEITKACMQLAQRTGGSPAVQRSSTADAAKTTATLAERRNRPQHKINLDEKKALRATGKPTPASPLVQSPALHLMFDSHRRATATAAAHSSAASTPPLSATPTAGDEFASDCLNYCDIAGSGMAGTFPSGSGAAIPRPDKPADNYLQIDPFRTDGAAKAARRTQEDRARTGHAQRGSKPHAKALLNFPMFRIPGSKKK